MAFAAGAYHLWRFWRSRFRVFRLLPLLCWPFLWFLLQPANGTWLAYLLATIGLMLVGLRINQFAKRSASPGALFVYIGQALGPKRRIYLGLVVASGLHLIIGRCFGGRIELYFRLASNCKNRALIKFYSVVFAQSVYGKALKYSFSVWCSEAIIVEYVSKRHFLDRDWLYLAERDFVLPAGIKLGCSYWAFKGR